MPRYNAINAFLKSKFSQKVYKVTLDIGTTCPNRAGTAGLGGCIYCNPESGTSLQTGKTGVKDQLFHGIEYIRKRHKAEKFIAYFQQHSNTYGNPERLEQFYHEATLHPDIVGIAISSRPDCISDKILDVLEELNSKTFMWVELGLQSADNDMLNFLNRGHTVEDFISAAKRLHERKIAVTAHVILGLPNETDEDIKDIARLINRHQIEGIKIHNLHVIKDTHLENLYRQGKIELISLDEYARRVVLLLENLNPDVLIHRFNSHAPRRYTIAPEWSINKIGTFNAVERELARQDTRQGNSLTIGRRFDSARRLNE